MHCFTKTSRYFPLIRNLAALISLTVVFSGSFALSTQSVEAKTSQNGSRRAGDYFVPPPPPYTPSMVPSALGLANAQAVSAKADDAVVKKHMFTRNQGDMQQVVQPDPYVRNNPGVETRIQQHIDSIDSEISTHQKEIGKLLNL
ncbi:MAG TPA: hypothetical protein V6C97_17195 [Oculatellaceae cyanobacterium]